MKRSTRPTVCHVTTSFPLYPGHPSGWFVWEQARLLPGMGWNVKVLAPHIKGAKERETMEGVEVFRYRYMNQSNETVAYGGGIPANLKADPVRWLWVPPFFAFGLFSAARLIKDVDIIHAHWSFSGLIAFGATRIIKKPYVLTFHGSDIMGAKEPMQKAAQLAAQNASVVITHSQAMKEAAAKLIKPGKIEVIPHGIDVESFKIAKPGKKIQKKKIIAVGRLSTEKGFDVLIRALSLLSTRNDWVCQIVGQGPEKAALESLAKSLGIFDRVELIGEVPHHEMVEILAQSHMAVVSSRREGFGMACAEMSAAGLPVAATKCGGPEDIIDHEKTGLLVEIENPDQMAQNIALLLDDPKLREKLGKAGRNKIEEKFSNKQATEKLIEIYKTFL